jgi:hypothetical protein
MRRTATALALIALAAIRAGADPADLSDGVFITHCPPGLSYTTMPTDWCAVYQEHAITECAAQVPRIDVKTGVVWYVLSAWHDSDKEWCGVEFGLGQFDPGIWAFAGYGPCGNPEPPIEIPNEGWPAPMKGTAIATTGAPWKGNFRPVYFFAGYAYYPGVIPLSGNSVTGFSGWASCPSPDGGVPKGFMSVCLGKLGLFQDGRACCPPPPLRLACCVAGECVLLTADECRQKGGILLTGLEQCGQPDACSLLRGTIWGTIRAVLP